MEKARHIRQQVVDILGTNEVYLVGGSVRDLIMGGEPKDYDFTTSLTPEEMKPLIRKAGRRVYNVGRGEKHGTVTFKVEDTPKHFIFVEVTTHRTEVYDGKTRQPVTTFGVSLGDDLARRDFTMNAIAYDGEKLIDPYGGRIDISRRLIKSVGVAKDRLTEDPLRMLRAARFASQLGFNIESNLLGKMGQLSPKIYIVSRERWVLEIDKLLLSSNPGTGLGVMLKTGLMKYILPEVAILFDDYGWGYVEELSRSILSQDTLDYKWLALLWRVGEPLASLNKHGAPSVDDSARLRKYMLDGIASRLKFSNSRRDVLLNGNIALTTSMMGEPLTGPELGVLTVEKQISSEDILDAYERGEVSANEVRKIINKNVQNG